MRRTNSTEAVNQNRSANRPSSYASLGMKHRRQRILSGARQLIEERGADQSFMGEIGQYAGVATRTVYNLFGSREQLITDAIAEQMAGAMAPMSEHPTLDANMKRMAATVDFHRGIANSAQALMSVYFGTSTPESLRMQIDRPVRRCNLGWLERVAARGELAAGKDATELADDLVRFEFATMFDWSQGRIADSDILRRMMRGYLGLAISALSGQSQRAVAARLTAL